MEKTYFFSESVSNWDSWRPSIKFSCFAPQFLTEMEFRYAIFGKFYIIFDSFFPVFMIIGILNFRKTD